MSLRVSRWTYAVIMPAPLLYFPMTSGRLKAVTCEWTFDFQLAVYSLKNTEHMIMFAVFFVLSYA